MLLILSAMLSALTGAMGARAPELRSHQSAVLREAAQVAPARVGIVRPVASLPRLAETARRPRSVSLGLSLAIPLYATRRRE